MVRHGSRSMPVARNPCKDYIVNRFYAFVAVTRGASDRGPVHVAATGRGVAAVDLGSPSEAFSAELGRRGLVDDPGRAADAAVTMAARGLEAVLALLDGDPAPGPPLPLDLGDRPDWDRLVLDAVRAIPRGSTAGYGEVARRIGRPGAARAVGGAVGRNPVGLLVPCHRVIAGDGTLGGYGVAAWGGREGALDLKRSLLALEGVRVERGRVSPR
jgi:methylated-DNA-[protein]-cysteine S-methyltransferase